MITFIHEWRTLDPRRFHVGEVERRPPKWWLSCNMLLSVPAVVRSKTFTGNVVASRAVTQYWLRARAVAGLDATTHGQQTVARVPWRRPPSQQRRTENLVRMKIKSVEGANDGEGQERSIPANACDMTEIRSITTWLRSTVRGSHGRTMLATKVVCLSSCSSMHLMLCNHNITLLQQCFIVFTVAI